MDGASNDLALISAGRLLGRSGTFVTAEKRPTGLLVTCLALTRLKERNNGSYRRLALLARGIAASGASLRVCCSLAPEDANRPIDELCREIETGIRDDWGIEASAVASVGGGTSRTPWFVQQAATALWYGNDPFVRARVNRDMREALATELSRAPAFVVAHRLPAMFAVGSVRSPARPIIFDLDDVEHVVATRNAEHARDVRSKLAGLAAVPSLLREERRAVRRAARTLVCSRLDAARVARLFGVDTIDVVPNALPIPPRVTPLAHNATMLMVAAYDYDPNADAADYFITRIFPSIRERFPNAQLRLVGGKPEWIPSFSQRPAGVTFVGFVPDLAAEYARARLVICPIRSGGGTRVKLVEAAGRGKPIVSTTIGAEGLDMVNGTHALIADDATSFAESCGQLLIDDERCNALSRAVRALAEDRYDARIVAEELGRRLSVYLPTADP